MSESVDRRILDLGIRLPEPLKVPPGVELPLGIGPALRKRRFDALSGGEQTRCLPAGLFARQAGFPLIDQPTGRGRFDTLGIALSGHGWPCTS